MPDKEELELPNGWKWDQDWTVDMNRGVDDEGNAISVFSGFKVTHNTQTVISLHSSVAIISTHQP